MNHPFQWTVCPEAEKISKNALERAAALSPFVARLQKELLAHASCHLFDFLDHVILPLHQGTVQILADAGYVEEGASLDGSYYYHPGAQLPKIVLKRDETIGLAVKVENIAEFCRMQGVEAAIEGSPFSPYRRALCSDEHGVSIYAIERRGGEGIEPIWQDSRWLETYLLAKEKWMLRPRCSVDEGKDMEAAVVIASEIASLVGRDVAAWIVLECERIYWQAKNLAGQMQKNRQDSLGMGWANHDHHTFRSSRKLFPELVRLFEILGFHCRERFYAGKEAGWGAQVMENPRAGLVLFLDLDLLPEELEFDFAHEPLREIQKLGTIGLWCALHGDSILKSGMHHLEAQFSFESLRADLEHLGIQMMDPFSNFDYLKQAFTHGQVWPVDSVRVETLLAEGKITFEQGQKFLKYGAVGSHLENLQRKEGYKGFNQKNVSVIIAKTDPRRL